MNNDNNLSQEQFQELLISVYTKTNDSNEISAIDIVNEIKQKLLTIYSPNSHAQIGDKAK
ncbi:hypothetical protein ELQ35_06865 [Peribacillus cavernae]|uniref:Uncharacterized protein n=1 Tax=Peribacillus cavernae TaxID=1674310 RepID=A0A3S0W0N7_9BACI|nr:hypothetical protein [Peribacillus cavernae]MDQ0217491.1 hypothetical protein [Peribacillus cavernae]RUQ30068.1 hypothetical protein ELQ35_06865 [Peribacillus cavernae]